MTPQVIEKIVSDDGLLALMDSFRLAHLATKKAKADFLAAARAELEARAALDEGVELAVESLV